MATRCCTRGGSLVPLQSLNVFTGAVTLGHVGLEDVRFDLMQDSTRTSNLRQILQRIKRKEKREKKRKFRLHAARRNDPGHGFPASQVRCEASRVRRQFHGSGRAPLQPEGPRRFGRGRQRRFGDRLADAARTLRSAYPQPFDAGCSAFRERACASTICG